MVDVPAKEDLFFNNRHQSVWPATGVALLTLLVVGILGAFFFNATAPSGDIRVHKTHDIAPATQPVTPTGAAVPKVADTNTSAGG